MLDACANLFRGPAFFGLLIGVDDFFHAGGAGGAVGALKATVQAVMAQDSVAVAVARLLVQDGGDGCCHLVGDDLILVGEVDSGELVASQNGGKRFDWRGGVIGRDVIGGVDPLSGGDEGDHS